MAKIVGKNIGDVPGTIKDFGGGTLEPGYLLCDGTSYLVASYPALFSKIGYTYGGAGANFNVPNAKGRGTIGTGNYTDPVSGSTTRTLGQSGGAEAHVLTTAQLAAHGHTGSTDSPGAYSHGHQLAIVDGNGSGGGTVGFDNDNDNPVNYIVGASGTTGATDGAHGHTFTTANAGSGNSHNNMQPYLAVTKMIKY